MSYTKDTAELRPRGTANPDTNRAEEDVSISLENKA